MKMFAPRTISLLAMLSQDKQPVMRQSARHGLRRPLPPRVTGEQDSLARLDTSAGAQTPAGSPAGVAMYGVPLAPVRQSDLLLIGQTTYHSVRRKISLFMENREVIHASVLEQDVFAGD
jgi:hypothetical protein